MESTTEPNEKIIDLIRKCLALSESPNENESAAAMSKAQELLEKYNLSMSQVSDRPEDRPELIDATVYVVPGTWLRSLYDIVARHNFCKCIGHPSLKNISICGRIVNVEATVEMTQWLEQQIERITTTAINDLRKYTILENGAYYRNLTSKRQYRLDFLMGVVKRIGERMTSDTEVRRSSDNVKALVLRLDLETANFVHQVYPNLYNGRVRVANGEGYHAGYAAGDKVSMVRPSHHLDGGALRLGGGN